MIRSKNTVATLLLFAFVFPAFADEKNDSNESKLIDIELNTVGNFQIGYFPSFEGIFQKGNEALERSGKSEAILLSHTLQLDFELISDEDTHLIVSCATREFETSLNYNEIDGMYDFSIEGEVFETEDGRIIVSYTAKTGFTDLNESVDGTFTLRGSTMVTMEKEMTLGILGEDSLKLTVTEVD